MNVSTLLGLSAFLFTLIILSALIKLIIVGISHLQYYLSRKEREEYEEIYKRLATQALEGPLLLSDQRQSEPKAEQPKPPEPSRRPRMAPASCNLSDPFERKFA